MESELESGFGLCFLRSGNKVGGLEQIVVLVGSCGTRGRLPAQAHFGGTRRAILGRCQQYIRARIALCLKNAQNIIEQFHYSFQRRRAK